MKKQSLCRLLFLSVCLQVPCQAGLKVYYLRHAQSGSNAKNEWKHVPVEKRPAFVGNADAFSPLGAEQAAAVPKQLAAYRFDFIAVSPKWRTRQTILSYLKAHDRHAQIWPELIEFGSNDGEEALIGSRGLPKPRADFLARGKAIELPAEERPYFTVRHDAPTEPLLGAGGSQGAADLTDMIQRAILRVRTEFGATDQSILLVGHGNAGRHFLELLTHDRETTKESLRNVGLWMAEEQADGRFKIMMVNGRPTGTPPVDATPAASGVPAKP